MPTDSTSKSIDDFTDAELAAMVRKSCYVQHARFGDGPSDARFLLVTAVPYSPDEGIDSLADALEAYNELYSADDWDEREFCVYDHQHGFFAATLEQVKVEDEDDTEDDDAESPTLDTEVPDERR